MKRNALIIVTVLLFGSLFCVFAQQPYKIKGKITDQNNNPLSSQWVMITLKDSIIGKSLTGDDGKFFIDNLPPNNYQIIFTRTPDLNSILDSFQFQIVKDTLINIQKANNNFINEQE